MTYVWPYLAFSPSGCGLLLAHAISLPERGVLLLCVSVLPRVHA
jgi:hypothetical protein